MLINFDYDGVIVDSFYQLLAITKQAQIMINEGRIPIETDFTESQNLTFESLAKQLGISDEKGSEYAKIVLQLQNETNWNPLLFPRLQDTLATLSTQYDLAIITASNSKTVQQSLVQHGISKCFSHISGGELGLSKAERIKHSCDFHKVSLTDAYMIGDMVGDIRQGKIAGVKTVAVTWGYQNYKILAKENPDFIIDSVDSLLEIFCYK